jgi:molybdate transport system substrate-binding protein
MLTTSMLTTAKELLMRRRVLTALAALAAATTLLSGCGPGSSGAAAPAPAAAPSGSITVFAAASLTESFTALGKQFEAARPGTKINFSFGASSTLAAQISQGAPADVFASASPKNMDQVVAAKAAANPTVFARNVPQIAVPAGNPARITTVADLAAPGVKVAVCASAVPIGALSEQIFAKAGVTVKPATIEPDVKSVVAKVKLGEVDAGIVFVTDVRAAGARVRGISIPADLNGTTKYPIAPLTTARNAPLAQAFVDYVLSGDGASVLTAAGFEKP